MKSEIKMSLFTEIFLASLLAFGASICVEPFEFWRKNGSALRAHSGEEFWNRNKPEQTYQRIEGRTVSYVTIHTRSVFSLISFEAPQQSSPTISTKHGQQPKSSSASDTQPTSRVLEQSLKEARILQLLKSASPIDEVPEFLDCTLEKGFYIFLYSKNRSNFSEKIETFFELEQRTRLDTYVALARGHSHIEKKGVIYNNIGVFGYFIKENDWQFPSIVDFRFSFSREEKLIENSRAILTSEVVVDSSGHIKYVETRAFIVFIIVTEFIAQEKRSTTFPKDYSKLYQKQNHELVIYRYCSKHSKALPHLAIFLCENIQKEARHLPSFEQIFKDLLKLSRSS